VAEPSKNADRSVRTGASNRGTNQVGVRLYNERLVLSIIRRHRELPKADIARLTGLSPQTISIIMNQLTADGLLLRGNPTRGRVGQPSVPYSLDPNGAYFLGLKVGRRASDVVLMDFRGQVLNRIHEPHPYSSPEDTLALIRRGTTELVDGLSAAQRRRIAGFGIASPFELWNWEPQFGAPPEVLEAWRHTDLVEQARRISPWPIYFHNDGTSACAAELVLGHATDSADFLYIFIGSFIGGGVVLDRHLYPGRSLYSGAIGPMPIPDPQRPGRYQQVLRTASIYVLGEALRAAGRDPAVLAINPDDWGDLGKPLDDWIEAAGRALALTIISAVSIIDFETIVIDGAFPLGVRRRLVDVARSEIELFDRQGVSPFSIVEGSIGSAAREIGGATLPLLANFTQDREVLFKDDRRSLMLPEEPPKVAQPRSR
jgi:predicted NBD/HSP70 family sugar kinase